MVGVATVLGQPGNKEFKMADSREVNVWSHHALQQWESSPDGHSFNENDPMVITLHELGDGVKKVVDLGCGGGLWYQMFDGYDYTGIDQNEEMIRYAKKRWPSSKFLVSEGEKTPLEDGSVDLVFTSAVLQHNLHARKGLVVEEIHRVLRPGGYYLCTENTFRPDNYHHSFPAGWAFSDDLDDGYTLTFAGWEKYMKPFGFTLLKKFRNSDYLYQRE